MGPWCTPPDDPLSVILILLIYVGMLAGALAPWVLLVVGLVVGVRHLIGARKAEPQGMGQ